MVETKGSPECCLTREDGPRTKTWSLLGCL